MPFPSGSGGPTGVHPEEEDIPWSQGSEKGPATSHAGWEVLPGDSFLGTRKLPWHPTERGAWELWQSPSDA